MAIDIAVVPVAGVGTRLLPATKSQPKEMLPVGRKPVAQHVVDELAGSGIRRLLFITGKGKHSIENHFDSDAELVTYLRESGREEELAEFIELLALSRQAHDDDLLATLWHRDFKTIRMEYVDVTDEEVASFKALGAEVCIRSEGIGEVWVVPEYTGADRQELSVGHSITLATICAAFPGAKVVAMNRGSN